jgi:hypothetical protein
VDLATVGQAHIRDNPKSTTDGLEYVVALGWQHAKQVMDALRLEAALEHILQ